MKHGILSRVLIFIVLAALCVSAFYIRRNNFANSIRFSIDEELYYILGTQLARDITDYNSIVYANMLQLQKDDPLPQYFFEPLFKHPPLFPLTVAVFVRWLGFDFPYGVFPSILFGCGIILLGYAFGKLLFDWITGLLTAFLIWFDPINIICSQKIWMDSMLAFFILLTVYLFSYAVFKKRDNFFIYAGIACGVAVNTKYPGILGLVIMLFYCFLWDPHLLRKVKLRIGLIIPYIMLIPWVLWNWAVYGQTHFSNFITLHIGKSLVNFLIILIILLVPFFVFFFLFRSSRAETTGIVEETIQTSERGFGSQLRKLFVLFFCLTFLFAMREAIFAFFNPNHFPFVSWQWGMFRHPLFYFERLIEFSVFYLVAFIAYFIPNKERLNQTIILYLSAAIIIVFFLFWGNYQSRYILAATPFLILLAVCSLRDIFSWLYSIARKGHFVGKLGMAGMIILLGFCWLRISYINFLVSFPNGMCYF
jgi:hypothetical protein